MNFSFLDSLTDLDVFKRYCYEAEEFAHNYPDISLTAARKAMLMQTRLYTTNYNQCLLYNMPIWNKVRSKEEML